MKCLNILVQILLLWVKERLHSFSEMGHLAFLENSIESKYLKKNNIEW